MVYEVAGLKGWLALTGIAAFISVFGSIVGILFKDYFLSRGFENWKRRQVLEQTYKHFKDPLLLAANELATRVIDILNNYPTLYLTSETLGLSPKRQLANRADDPYFRSYQLKSTVFRFCAFLGWVELYRQEVTYLDSGSNAHTIELAKAIALIRDDLADGHLNTATNWFEYHDVLIFREELRAVGEAMIESRGSVRTVLGYGRFTEIYNTKDIGHLRQWADVVTYFLIDLDKSGLDFRKIRFLKLALHLLQLIQILDKNPLNNFLAKKQDELLKELEVSI